MEAQRKKVDELQERLLKVSKMSTQKLNDFEKVISPAYEQLKKRIDLNDL